MIDEHASPFPKETLPERLLEMAVGMEEAQAETEKEATLLPLGEGIGLRMIVDGISVEIQEIHGSAVFPGTDTLATEVDLLFEGVAIVMVVVNGSWGGPPVFVKDLDTCLGSSLPVLE